MNKHSVEVKVKCKYQEDLDLGLQTIELIRD